VPAIDYSTPGIFTALDDLPDAVFETGTRDPVSVCWPVHDLVVHPYDISELDLPPERLAANQLRPASALVAELLQLDPAPLAVPRPPHLRVVGTCRHFAVFSCALLRRRGIPARARCGFATYFQPGRGVDHWVTEYWDEPRTRWVRVDSEYLGGKVLERPHELTSEQFLTGGEAWEGHRRGDIDAATYGVHGTDNWGRAEIQGNVVRDLAALNKLEMLPWDEWGQMTDAYAGRTGLRYDELLDEVAVACREDDPDRLATLFAADDLAVPGSLIR